MRIKYSVSNYTSELRTSFYLFKGEMIKRLKEEIREGDHVHLYTLLAIILIGSFIRIYLNFYKHMYGDEGVAAAMFIMQPLHKLFSNYDTTGNHVFFSFLSHLSWKMFGGEPLSFRLPALLAGVLLIPASYLFVRSFYNKHAALLASALVASSHYLIRYSIEARGYSMIVLFFLLIVVIATYLKEKRNLFLWLLFSILSALGAFTIPVMLYPFGIVIMFLLLSAIFKDTNVSRDSFLKDISIFTLITVLLTFLLYSPVIIVNGLKSLVANETIARRDWQIFISQLLPAASELWNEWTKGIPFIIKYIIAIGFPISLFYHNKISIHRVKILTSTVLWIIPVFIYLRADSDGLHRVWIFLLPLYFGLSSSGLYYLLTRIIEPKYRNYKSLMFSILSIVLILSLGASVVKAQRNMYYETEGTLKNPDFVTLFLKINYEPGDRFIYSWLGWNVNLDYHFMLHRYPGEGWSISPKSAKRLLVYVDHDSKETLENAMNNAGLTAADYNSIDILIHDKHATIYALRKLKDGQTSYEFGKKGID